VLTFCEDEEQFCPCLEGSVLNRCKICEDVDSFNCAEIVADGAECCPDACSLFENSVIADDAENTADGAHGCRGVSGVIDYPDH